MVGGLGGAGAAARSYAGGDDTGSGMGQLVVGGSHVRGRQDLLSAFCELEGELPDLEEQLE